jgi:hypothetical protein
MLLEECKRVQNKIGFSELETLNPKSGHAMAATKEFVFITGGNYRRDDRTFEILVLANNSLFRGPDMKYSRESHCSFMIQEYLYVMFGSVLSSYGKTMSFERIKIPQPGMEITLESFYKNRKWEYYEMKHDRDHMNIFRVAN